MSIGTPFASPVSSSMAWKKLSNSNNQRETMSTSCIVRGFWWDGLSESGGTSRLSIVASTSFQRRAITIFIASPVRVLFIMAKLSLK